MRVHITGAAGSGTTTLGKALASETGIAHFDTDAFFWLPVDPPFSKIRPTEQRLRMMDKTCSSAGSWVLSGYLGPWAAPLFQRFDLVIFLLVPTEVRLARLRARESQSSHALRWAPGGDRHAAFERFLSWAASYDTGGLNQRSRATHEAFFRLLSCPVLRLEGERPLHDQLRDSLAAVAEHGLRAAREKRT